MLRGSDSHRWIRCPVAAERSRAPSRVIAALLLRAGRRWPCRLWIVKRHDRDTGSPIDSDGRSDDYDRDPNSRQTGRRGSQRSRDDGRQSRTNPCSTGERAARLVHRSSRGYLVRYRGAVQRHGSGADERKFNHRPSLTKGRSGAGDPVDDPHEMRRFGRLSVHNSLTPRGRHDRLRPIHLPGTYTEQGEGGDAQT